MAASVRSVNVENVKRLVEAVQIGDGFDMEKILRAASDIGGYAPETTARYEPDGRAGESDDIERFEWEDGWLGLKEPEAEILFNLSRQPYMPSDITREHLLAVLEAICEGAPVDRDIWVRNDPERGRQNTPRRQGNQSIGSILPTIVFWAFDRMVAVLICPGMRKAVRRLLKRLDGGLRGGFQRCLSFLEYRLAPFTLVALLAVLAGSSLCWDSWRRMESNGTAIRNLVLIMAAIAALPLDQRQLKLPIALTH